MDMPVKVFPKVEPSDGWEIECIKKDGVYRYMPIIPAHRKLMQEDLECGASLAYRVRACF